MTSVFLKSGNTFRPSSEEAMQLHKILPVGNYVLKHDPRSSFFLEEVDPFELPSKLYGATNNNAERIVTTFKSRPNTTGVMLVGEKGSGKTLLARQVALEAANDDVPTIIINTPYVGDEFNSFIQGIEQPCVILFDEFEKVYNKESQEGILTLLDGVFPSKKLFILTCNDKWQVDQHLRNRPGRIFYMFEYKGIEADFIREYCNENLFEKSHIERICQLTGAFESFNFDMLKALVEEMNRYNDTPDDALEILNIKPEYTAKNSYNVRLWIGGKEISKDKLDTHDWHGAPMSKFYASFNYRVPAKPDDEDQDDDYASAYFKNTHLKEIRNGVYIFKNEKGEVLHLEKEKQKVFDYRAL